MGSKKSTTVSTPAGEFTITAPVTNEWGTRCTVTQNGNLVATLEKVGEWWYGRVEFSASASLRNTLGHFAGQTPECLISGAVEEWYVATISR